jgi:hypothetical protein
MIKTSIRNSVDTEFRRHEIPLTRNSVDTEFPRRHGILSTRNSIDTEFRKFSFTSVHSVCYAIVFIFVLTQTKFRMQNTRNLSILSVNLLG